MNMTIKQIAELAGVSQATVSLALNNRPGVGEKTKQCIWDIAIQHGYKKCETEKKSLLFVKYIEDGEAVEQNGDFVARMIDAIEYTASSLNYKLVIKNIQKGEFEKEIKSIHYEDFSGVILLATELQSHMAKHIEQLSIPLVAIDNMFEDYDVNSVVMDNYGGIGTAVRYLYDLGHRRIGYIDSKARFSNFQHRSHGYYKAIESLQMDYKEEDIKYVYPSLEGAYGDMLKLLKENTDLPTAFVAANDTIAIGAVKAIKEVGLKIPNDLSIIGFDDIPYCLMLDQGLTTMRVDKERLGALAVELIDDKINKASKEIVKMLVRTKLIVRESAN